jgi:hypothetical protein
LAAARQPALYRLVFVGGLFDGHEAYWHVLPEPCVKLYSAQASRHAIESSSTDVPRALVTS